MTTSRLTVRSVRSTGSVWLALGMACLVGLLAAGCSGNSSSATTPSPVQINGSASVGSFSNNEQVTVSIGANKILLPHQKVLMIQCADPGGKASNLPTQYLNSCDSNTLQGDTVIPNSDGSFSYSGYVMNKLPSTELGEVSDALPVCDESHYCVLYVGQDWSDFSKPKVFSAPFTVHGGGS